VDVLGIANPTAGVTVNGNTANRHGEYFHHPLVVDNSSALYTNITVISFYGSHETNSGDVRVPPSTETFVHDADGNLVSDGLWTNTWDAENRLTQMESVPGYPTAGKRKLEFVYDAQGRRIQKIVSTNNGSAWLAESTNRFVYDGWNLIAELSASQLPLCVYVWGLDLSGSPQGAGGVGGLLERSEISTGSLTNECFVAYDGNGSVAALLHALSSSLTVRYEYGPFGEVLRATGPTGKANPFRFSTKFQDPETDLLYYGYRYYSASMARWVSNDPIQERGGKNLCAIARNDLICHADLLGLSFSVVPREVAPGTLDPNNPGLYGDTWPTKYETLKFRVERQTLSCSYCAIVHVTKDFEVEVTSIKPSSVPPGFDQNGFEYIRSHEDRRADVYRRAYAKYLQPVEGKLDGVTLCCRHPCSGQLGLWASQVEDMHNAMYLNFVTSQNALLSAESNPLNYRRNEETGLITGGYYTYEPGPMPEIGPLPELTCP
jgi:RHS repeat-associated protein